MSGLFARRVRPSRRPETATALRLRTHLMGAVLIALLPSLIIGGATVLFVANSFLNQYDADRVALAGAISSSFERRVGALIGRSARAIAADIGAGDRNVEESAWLHGLMAALRVDATLWRRTESGFAPGLLSGTDAMSAPALPDAVRETAASGRLTLVHGGPSEGGDLFALLAVPQTAVPPCVLQLTLTSERVGRFLSAAELASGATIRLIAPDGSLLGGKESFGADGIRELAGLMPDSARPPDDGPIEVGTRQGPTFWVAYAGLEEAPGWRVLVVTRNAARMLTWLVPMSQFMAAVAASVVLAVATVAWVATRLTRPLKSLTSDFARMASNAELPPVAHPAADVREFGELRDALRRSAAVLGRRAAAERMALNEARSAAELLSSVVGATKDLIYVKSLDLRLLLANRATLALGGVARPEWQVLGRTMAELIPADCAAAEEALDRRVLAGGESNTMRLDWPDAAGIMRSFMLTKSLWRETAGAITGVVTVARDVTEERAAEARLAGVQADLLRVTRLSAMGAMASGLAHELNQPLAAATNFLNAAGRLLVGPPGASGTSEAELGRMARGAVAEAAEQMLRAGEIVRRLRAFIGRGEAELRSEELGGVIREACALAWADSVTTPRPLVVTASGSGVMALLDRTQIQQVLLNLIRNAAEALQGPGDGRIEIACTRRADGGARIAVSDNGPGLAAEVLPRLFEPFVSTKRDGMGIGLAICRTIVEGHGGRLSASARDGGGTVFSIDLPPVQPQLVIEASHAA